VCRKNFVILCPASGTGCESHMYPFLALVYPTHFFHLFKLQEGGVFVPKKWPEISLRFCWKFMNRSLEWDFYFEKKSLKGDFSVRLLLKNLSQ